MRLHAALVLFACVAAFATTALAQTESNDLCVSKVSNNATITIMKPLPDVDDPNLQGQRLYFLGKEDGVIYFYNLTSSNTSNTSSNQAPLLEQVGVVVDLSDQVLTLSEANQIRQQQQQELLSNDTFMGLLDFAFHPNWTDNYLFYTFFTCNPDTFPQCNIQTCDQNCPPQLCNNETNQCQYDFVEAVVEWYVDFNDTLFENLQSVDPNEMIFVANLSRVILVIPVNQSSNHGGALNFDKTGRLIVGVGDGLTSTNQVGNAIEQSLAQNLSSIYGKILRVGVFDSASQNTSSNENATYFVPQDNPFVDVNGAQPLVWALGLRNPWRCSLDLQNTSRLICVDSALNQTQEVNLIERAGNYGWPIFEGNFLNPDFDSSNEDLGSTTFIEPFTFYNQTYNNGESNSELNGTFATGAIVYRGNASQCHVGKLLVTDLFGSVFFANLTTGESGQQQQEQPANLTLINLVCSDNSSALPCSQDNSGGSQSQPVVVNQGTRIWGLAQGKQGQLFILSDSGIWMATSQDNCNIQCSSDQSSGGDTPVETTN